MSLAIHIPSSGDVAFLDEVKNHIKQDADITDDDALVMVQVRAALDVIETATGANRNRSKVALATTFDLVLDCFGDGCIEVPRVPLISVESITYIDTAGVTQTLSTSIYTVDVAAGKIDLAYNQYWPSTRTQPNAITVRFVAGIAAVFTAVPSTDILTVSGRTFSTGDVVQVVNSGGSLPGGLVSATPYYVISPSGSTFKLSLTSGGTAVDVTQAGSGVHYIGLDISGFTTLRQAVLLQVANYYRNRGDNAFRQAGSIDVTQRTIDALVASQAA